MREGEKRAESAVVWDEEEDMVTVETDRSKDDQTDHKLCYRGRRIGKEWEVTVSDSWVLDLRRRVPWILKVEVDRNGGPRVQQTTMASAWMKLLMFSAHPHNTPYTLRINSCCFSSACCMRSRWRRR